MGDTTTSDNVAQTQETETTNVNNEANINNTEDIPSAINIEVGPDNEVRSETMEICPSDGDRSGPEAMGDSEWVIWAATILMQNGREKEWEEVVKTWMRLQRSWERNEVRKTIMA